MGKGPSYWLDLFTWKTWCEFLAAGGNISGFRESRWKSVARIKPGDRLLCYITGISRWIGVLEVTSEAYRDNSPIWADSVFPCRLHVEVLAELEPGTAVPVLLLRNRLSIFEGLSNPNAWSGRFRGSPTKFPQEDGKLIEQTINEAVSNPVNRDFDHKKLERRPKFIRTKIGEVTVPESDETGTEICTDSVTKHTVVQSILLRMGSEMGLGVWVAPSDRSKSVEGQVLGEIRNSVRELPTQFDEATSQTIRNIDVLWLDGASIVAAFEIESTTSIYSGLLRMSDLVAMQPNLSIPLYLVAPEDRRGKVISEVNRPTFARLPQPLSEIVSLIPFGTLMKKYESVKDVLQHMRPSILEEISESCEPEEG